MSKSKEAQQAYRNHTGKEHADTTSPFDPPSMGDVADATFNGSYGVTWTRTDLDMQTKSFICMAITATLGTEDQFKAHLRAAHHVGITKEQIVGMLVHFMAYLGAPRTSVARRLVREVWAELAKQNPAAR
jgi:4-carboxymuconolactone decarboxylase